MSKGQLNLAQTPQLVLTGIGSIDDPEGVLIYDRIRNMIDSHEYQHLKGDIIAVRIPPIDQLLNALLRGAKVALQLSHREGFEIKVTEAIAKGIPVVAYRAGGIPHQIIDKRNGFLVAPGDFEQVAAHLYNLLMDKDMYDKMSRLGRHCVTEEYYTLFQATSWLFLANELFESRDLIVDMQGVQLAATYDEDDGSRDEDDLFISSDGLAQMATTSVQCQNVCDKKDFDSFKEWERDRIRLSGRGVWAKELWYKKYFGRGWRKSEKVDLNRARKERNVFSASSKNSDSESERE